jgi:hypothetical protein
MMETRKHKRGERGPTRPAPERINTLAARVILGWLTRGVQKLRGGQPVLDDEGAPVYCPPSAKHVAVAIAYLRLHLSESDLRRMRREATDVEMAFQRLKTQ